MLKTKPSARPTCVDKFAFVIDSQHQCTKTWKTFFRRSIPCDHKLLPLDALHFEPIASASRLVRRVSQLRDNPFNTLFACLFEKLDATAFDVIAVTQRAARSLRL